MDTAHGRFKSARFPPPSFQGRLPHACKAVIVWIALIACAPVSAETLPATSVVTVACLPLLRRWMRQAPRLLPALALLALGTLSVRLMASGSAMTAAALMLCALPAVLVALLRQRQSMGSAQTAPALARAPGTSRAHEERACHDRPPASGGPAQADADLQADRVRLLTAVSHDLRQPIHAIGLLVAAIKEQPHSPATARLVGRLDRSLCGLDELFGRLLEFGRAGAGNITPEMRAFEVEPVLLTLQERFAQVGAQRGLRLRFRSSPGLVVDSDPALVVEILMNLLSNALRYTTQGGVLLTARRSGPHVALQVWDTGLGIERPHLDRIFDEFVQLDPHARGRRQGLGLGLAIVRRLAHDLGATVTVQSRPGRGSTFTVLLPAAASSPEPGRVDRGGGDTLRGLLVLVVDDDADTLVATEAALSAWGCFVLLARDEHGALAAIERSERFPDLLITEYWIDGLPSGLHLAEAVRSAVPFELPVLVATSAVDDEIARRVLDHGCKALSKPAGPDRLRKALDEALSARR